MSLSLLLNFHNAQINESLNSLLGWPTVENSGLKSKTKWKWWRNSKLLYSYCHSRLHLKISAKADRWTTKVVLFPDCFYFLLLRFLRELQHIYFVLDTLFNFILCIGIWRFGHFTVLKKHSEQDSRPTKYTLKNHLKNNPPT